MKYILATALAAVLFGIAFNASATGKPDPVQPGNNSSSQSSSGSTSGASAGAVGVGVGTGIGTGGDATAIGVGGNSEGSSATGGIGGNSSAESGSYSALANDINYASSMRSISLANPVWTIVPQAGGKCTVSSSSAESLVFGVWSGSRSRQATDAECAMMQMSNSYRQSCQFKTAAMIDKTLFERFNAGADGSFLMADAVNLSPVACADLLRPRLIMDTRIQQPPVSVAPASVDVHVECSQPVRQSVPVRKPTQKKPARACPAK